MKLCELKKGEYFTKKPIEYPTENQVFIRLDYDISTQICSCVRFSDVNDKQFIRGDKEVFYSFIF